MINATRLTTTATALTIVSLSHTLNAETTALLSPAPSERASLTPQELISPIADALATVSDDIRAFDIHISTLANPFMQGRAPGSPGSEVAKDYIQFYFEQAGLTPPFESFNNEPVAVRTITKSYRQMFEMAGRSQVFSQAMNAVSQDNTRLGLMQPRQDFNATGLGTGGSASGQPVFVGYATVNDEYDAFAPNPDLDLTGKIAVMLGFEPMNEEGRSKFTGAQWSPAAGFAGKLRAVAQRNPEAVIIINPPNSADPRASRLLPAGGGGQALLDVPVFHMSSAAGDRLITALDPKNRSLATLKQQADSQPQLIQLEGEISLTADIQRTVIVPENIAGLLPGKGKLAHEYIVIGGHFDHVGDGSFGTPETIDQVHEGADDNASGTAGVLILADRLAKTYNELPENADARSILFIGFDAEESGLNGAEYYVQNPIAPIEDHVLMLNMDMIGRVVDGGLTLQGISSAVGFDQWLKPFMEISPLKFNTPAAVGSRSDHAPFYFQGNMPVLFGIINPLHSDYHTVRDEAWKVNRVGAVQVIDFFENIATAAALQPQRLTYNPPPAPIPQSRVLVGVFPQQASDGGVLLAQVTPGSAAAEAGLMESDRIIEWGGTEITSLDAWRRMLADHDPGDVVEVKLIRDGATVTASVKLRAR